MPKFRKKPVVIEAFRPFIDPTPGWFQAAMDAGVIRHSPGFDLGTNSKQNECFRINSNTGGVEKAFEGDWVILGTKGEIYPCKADIFADIYEAVE